MRIAAVQHDITWEDAEATRRHLEPLIASAAATGSRLIALTEMYATGFSMRTEVIAEDAGGPNEQFLRDQARRHGVWLVGSIAQWAPGGTGEPAAGDRKARNVAVLAAPDGAVYRYTKIHPFTFADEHRHYEAGREFRTVDVEGVRVTLFVCYDLRFADEFWQCAAATDVYVVVANWPAGRREHWRTLLRARAIENQAYVLGVNRVGLAGRTKPLEHAGDSALIDPLGRVLAEAAHVESVIFADVAPATVADVRARFPFMRDRRQ